MMALISLIQLLFLLNPPITTFPKFYIKNFPQAGQPGQLAQLLNGNDTKKIVFRLYQNNSGSFSLMAFGGKMGHKFDQTEILLTDTLSVKVTPEEFYIGDVELSKDNRRGNGTQRRTDDISILRDIRDRKRGSNVNYLLFTPKIDTIENSMHKKFKYFLSFQIDTLQSLSNLNPTAAGAALALPLRNKPNPSPPYDGN